MIWNALAVATLAIWIYLLVGRGQFWRSAQRDLDAPAPPDGRWPSIVAVIPARDEAEGVGDTIASLCRQDYPGDFAIVLVDDQSADGTAGIARAAAAREGHADRLTVLAGEALPKGWTGKLWAMKQGADLAAARQPDYLLFTDADIIYAPRAVARLARGSVAGGLALNSLMVRLRCETRAERTLIPAFIFFFQMLYPFAWVNRPGDRTAAAAGGSMLVARAALERVGGLGVIRDALIDDCALARALKAVGPIRLSLTEEARSTRRYASFAEARGMIARSAYAQLRYSPLLLAGTVAGMLITYLAPVALTLFAPGWAGYAGAGAWALMALAFRPTLAFHGLSAMWGVLLPAIAMIYLGFTLDSAWQHARGRGGYWKGRAQARVGGAP